MCGDHSYQCIHYFDCKRAVNIAIFHLFCTLIHDRLAKCTKNTVYTLQRIFLTQCLLLSMSDMYRSLALLCIWKIYFTRFFLTANYYADFYRSLFTAEHMLMQDEYLTCVSCRMNCKLISSHLLHYQGVLVLKVRNYYYKYYVHYKYPGVHFLIISICVDC